MGDVRIGTSGWAYKDWNGPFYPDEVEAAARLGYILNRFRTLEINASFYRMPTDKAVAGWRDQAPDDFQFAWKASRYITHNKKLKEPKDSLAYMFERADGLGDKLGPSCSSCRPSFTATTRGWRLSSTPCPSDTATASSSAIPAGTPTRWRC